jgi:hypothetical protein
VGQPCFGQFDLPTLVDALTEHAVQVTDAIAIGRDVEAGEALHEAGRQTPQTAIAQRRIGLQFFQLSQIQPMLAQGLLHFPSQAHVRERIAHQPPDQELQAEIIDPLAARIIGAPRGIHPGIDDLVAQRQNCGLEPVMRLGRPLVLADAVAQHIDDQIVDLGRDAGRIGCFRQRLTPWQTRAVPTDTPGG